MSDERFGSHWSFYAPSPTLRGCGFRSIFLDRCLNRQRACPASDGRQRFGTGIFRRCGNPYGHLCRATVVPYGIRNGFERHVGRLSVTSDGLGRAFQRDDAVKHVRGVSGGDCRPGRNEFVENQTVRLVFVFYAVDDGPRSMAAFPRSSSTSTRASTRRTSIGKSSCTVSPFFHFRKMTA